MTQIIEYAKIHDVNVICHFEFDRNDQLSIGDHFSCSINKYMCLNDWLAISKALNSCICELPTKSSSEYEHIPLRDLNIELKLNWIDLDPMYIRLVNIPAGETVNPFVMKLTVSSLTTIDSFRSIDSVESTQTTHGNTAAKKNDLTNTTPTYNLKRAIVLIEKINIDDYLSNGRDSLPPETISDSAFSRRESLKRPFSCIGDDLPSQSSDCAKVSSSSTPLLHKIAERLSKLEKSVSNISVIRRRRTAGKLKRTIGSTPTVKIRTKRKLRPAAEKRKTRKRVPRNKMKKGFFARGEEGADEVPIVPSANSTAFFEDEVPRMKTEVKNPTSPSPAPLTPNENEIFGLESISEVELKQSFKVNFRDLNRMVEEYKLQESDEVARAADYDHIDIISFLPPGHIQIMLDILYNHFVNAESHDTANCPSYANLFFEKIVPEWSIALIMAKFGMMREDVVEKIQKQKPNHSQIDDSQSIYVTQDSINEHF